MVFYFRLPFYYEIKVVFVIWLLSPATKGASILYRKFIHPQLSKREQVTVLYNVDIIINFTSIFFQH